MLEEEERKSNKEDGEGERGRWANGPQSTKLMGQKALTGLDRPRNGNPV